MIDKVTEIILPYWPVFISIILTFSAVHSIKRSYRDVTARRRRVYIRLTSFVIGLFLTFITLKGFSDFATQKIIYLSLFVGLFNPAIYWSLMVYLRIKKPQIYEQISPILNNRRLC